LGYVTSVLVASSGADDGLGGPEESKRRSGIVTLYVEWFRPLSLLAHGRMSSLLGKIVAIFVVWQHVAWKQIVLVHVMGMLKVIIIISIQF